MSTSESLIGMLVEASWPSAGSETHAREIYYGVILSIEEEGRHKTYSAIWRKTVELACDWFNEYVKNPVSHSIQTCSVGPGFNTVIVVINKNYGKGGDGKLRLRR